MNVEIWSDVVCPWCAIGKARFEQALESFPQRDEVTVTWRSFELDPQAPKRREGDYVSMLAKKYGTSAAQAQQMIDRMTDSAAEEGLDFDFSIAKPGNTFDAHRLLHLATDPDTRSGGLQNRLKDRLLLAYHSQGEAIGDHDTLQRLAVEVGLDEVEVKETLTGDGYADAVRADENQARTYGISGVPFFVLDGRIGISGAQPSDVMLEGLRQAWPETAPLQIIGSAAAEGDTCGIDGC